MNPKIVVVGSSNTDMIIQLDHLPKPGETILGGEFTTAAGGKGANQAVGAARAGGAVTFVARVGQDIFGEQAMARFTQDGIDVRFVYRDVDRPSGVALIFVAKDGANSIGVASGANARLSPDDVEKARSAFTGAQMLILQLEVPIDTVQAAADLAAEQGVKVILNPAPACSLPDSLLRRVNILTPNENEAELLTGIKVENEATAARAARELCARGVPIVILTLGSRGAWLATRDTEELVPGFPVKAVDTTAAGDIFNGALAVALSDGRALNPAVRFANAAAALSVTTLGAQPSAPTRSAIEAFLEAQAG